MPFAAVAVPVPALDLLTYNVPEAMEVSPGVRVVVPLGRRMVTGLVINVREEGEKVPAETGDERMATVGGQAGRPGPAAWRDVVRVLDSQPFLPAPVVELALWIADYYLCAPGEAVAAAMPPLAWVASERRWQLARAGVDERSRDERPAVRRILFALDERRALDVAALATALGGAEGVGAASRRASLERQLVTLEREGLVQSVQHLVGRADASRTERIVRLAPASVDEATIASLTARQRDALETIQDLARFDGEVAAAGLVREGVSAAVLGALVRRAVVSIGERRVERVSSESFGLAPGEADPIAPGRDGLTLTDEQANAMAQLTRWADERTFRVALVHGVTGSGKTEIYRGLARHVRDHGRQVLILVPEIALTPAVAATFRGTFGERVAIQHSALSDGERYDQWQRIRRSEVDVVVGTRSAVFTPLDRLGLVIVDEEHDTSYKQEETPRYHGRDAAIVRARSAGALVVLGSATPSLETFNNARQGRFALISLTRRVFDRPLADVRIVNMREELAASGADVVLSTALREAVGARLAEGEQAIILINRRGFAANVFCRQCGDTLACPNCSVSLTVHRGANRARCHYCDYSRRLPETCVSCGGTYLEYQGVGTERVEAEVREAFPGVRVVRVDRDTVRRRGEITRVLRRFARRELDVLVGTQMIAKGHDFPAVTLVGVISADVGLGLADFRAAERTFQLLTQVAGRAGRGERLGEAVIQTLFPDHYSIQLARAQDYGGFFEHELRYRQALRYPPVVSLVNLVVGGKSEADARRDAALLVDALGRHGRGYRVLGPAPAPLARLRGRHRVQLFVKGVHRLAMRQAVREALRQHPHLARRVTVDVDPLTVL